MHFTQFFGVAAVTAFTALALPAEIHPVVTPELKTLSNVQPSPGNLLEGQTIARAISRDISVRNSDDNSVGLKALTARVTSSPIRKNLFTIALQGGHAAFHGAIKWALQASINNANGVTTFHINPLDGGTYKATASLQSYEFNKNFLQTTFKSITAHVSFYYQTPAGTVYNFIARVVYGLDTRLALWLEDVQLFDIESATQKLAGQTAQKLLLGSYEDDYKDL